MADNQDRKNIKRDRRIEERRARLRDQAAARSSDGAPSADPALPSAVRDKAARRRRRRKSGQSRKRVPRRTPPIIYVRLILIIILLGAAVFGILRLREYITSGTDVSFTDKGFTHADRFEGCVVLNGIDVSTYQGEEINWKQVKTSGADFVFVRAGYRSASDGSLHEDDRFRDNVRGASRAGLMTGVYFYSQATSPAEAEEEAKYCLKLIRKYDLDLPVAIDYEIYPDGRLQQKIDAGKLAAASLYHDIVLAFCRKVEMEGYESVVYANQDMLTHYMDAGLLDDEAVIWLAQYGETSSLDADYWFWQCSDAAEVGGIEGNVDHDYWYIEPGKAYPTRAEGKKGDRVSIADCAITFSKESYRIRMRRATPEFELTYEDDTLKEGRDYEWAAVRNTSPGTGYVILRGTGRYKDWVMRPFTIE